MSDPDSTAYSPPPQPHAPPSPGELLGRALETRPITGNPHGWEPPSPADLEAQLPAYEVHAFLARGGMGAVYRGLQISLARPVAIKILPPELRDSDPHYAARFKQEARAMAQLNHPAIVSVYDFGEMPDGTFYFIMEFIDGTDVGQMVAQQGRLASAHAMAITAHVCDALQYAHERGIVHRDIKPANIMVGFDGRVKVADFGLAKSFRSRSTSLTQSGYVMGTPHFVAPEALVLGSSIDHRADIFAMGVMLYQMLTGKVPHGLFEMPSLQVPGLDPRYDVIISSAMREDREKRYQSVLEMRRALDCILTQPVLRSEIAKQTVPVSAVTQSQPPTEATPPKPQPGQPYYRPPQVSAPVSAPKRSKKAVVGWIANAAALALVVGGLKWLGSEKPVDPKVAITTASKEAPFINSLGMKFVPVPGTSVLMCIHETRRQDYEAYIGKVSLKDQSWRDQKFNGWPCGHQDDHPVVGVSWSDAKGFCEWLSRKEGLSFRLPTDREWSQAAGIGKKEIWNENEPPEARNARVKEYTWGNHFPPTTVEKDGNYADTAYKEHQNGESFIAGYSDGFSSTAPVMQFKANGFGFHDLGGNAREWVEDWWDTAKTKRILRGSAWHSCFYNQMYTASRHPVIEDRRDVDTGFRCVIEAPAKFGDKEFLVPIPTNVPLAVQEPQSSPLQAIPNPMLPVRIKEQSLSTSTTTNPLLAPAYRSFTNTKGQTIRAALARISGDDIVLRKDDGTDYTVKAATLSTADIDYLKTKGLVMPQAPAAPSAPAVAAVATPVSKPLPLPASKPAPTARVLDPLNMLLKDPWIPNNIHTRKVWLEHLAFYSREVMRNGSGTPSTIWREFTWLMPLSKATNALPRGSYKLKNVSAAKLAFPEGVTLEFWHVGGKGYEDDLEHFDEIVFVLDDANRLISLQLSENNTKDVRWSWREKMTWDGDRNPYYNFMHDRSNAKNGRLVKYQFRPASSGVTNVKLVLEGSESNHWYLTAPLADKLIQISEAVGKQGL